MRFWRPVAISSYAKERACEEEAHADENPQDAPWIFERRHKVKIQCACDRGTIPSGEQRITPSCCMRA